jgi:hypothetical protein
MLTKSRSDVSVARILAHLLRKGIPVSIPIGERPRFDLIIEESDGLKRVQCTTGRLIDGSITFHLASRNGSTRRAYVGEIELFLVYCPETDKVYRVPLDPRRRNQLRLRVDPLHPKSPVTKIHWAKKYEL